MEDDAADDLPLLEDVDAPALDERLIADEESRRDSRDTPLRQTPVIQSIHCGCYLGRMIDVKVVARKLWNAVFDPKRSQHGVLVGLRHPRVSVSVFPSGKVISMGAKSEASAILGCRKVARMIQRLPGYEAVRVSDFKVHNVTASGALGYRIDLKALARHPQHEEYVEYNPDQFPGLHYKLPDATAAVQSSAVKAEPSSNAHSSAIAAGPGVASTSAAAAGTAPGAAASASTPSSARSAGSSLTLTLYFSGRFTLVGAQNEQLVYQHFERISRRLFPFANINTKQQQQGQGQQGADSKQHLAYDVWLEASCREERLKGGRMGWEEEADRVRLEMERRERRRTATPATKQQQQQQQTAQQPQHAERRDEVRVKAEPGSASAAESAMRGEERKEADGVSGAEAPPTGQIRLTAPLSLPIQQQVDAASGKQQQQQGADERKETGEKEEKADERVELNPPLDSAVVVTSHHVEEAEAGDNDVEWE